jgi:hypothetical protein
MTQFDCFKCGGSGRVAFRHVENGVCFTCGGSGKLSYQPKQNAWIDPHPEFLVPEADRATDKQWNYLVRLCNDNDDTFRRFIRAAGGQFATQRYVSKALISKAINLAKASEVKAA